MIWWLLHRMGWFLARCVITYGFCWTLQSFIYQEVHTVVELRVLLLGSMMMVVMMRLWMPPAKE